MVYINFSFFEIRLFQIWDRIFGFALQMKICRQQLLFWFFSGALFCNLKVNKSKLFTILLNPVYL